MSEQKGASPLPNGSEGAVHGIFDRRYLLDRAVTGLNSIGTFWVLLLVLIINVDAFGRSFLNLPMAGVVEIVAISMALIVFFQLADTIRLGKLTRSEGYVDIWLSRPKGTGRTIVAGFEAAGAVFMLLIVVGTWPLLIRAYERGYYIGTEGVFTFPDWPIKAVVVFGASVAALVFTIRAARILAGRYPDPRSTTRAGPTI